MIVASSIVLNGCSPAEENVPKPTMSLPEKSAKVSVYYATGNTLVEEKHIVSDDADIIKSTLNELLAAKPQENSEIAIVQPESKVLSANVDKKGLVTINFDRRVLQFDALPKEKKLAYLGILQTLKQFKNVKAIRFVVEGKDSGTIIGKDIQGFWGNITLKNQPWQLR
jgi:spore germination protein GerM